MSEPSIELPIVIEAAGEVRSAEGDLVDQEDETT